MDNKVIWQDRKHFMWFPFSFTKYQIKNERLYQETGLISTHYDELLLYRITDLCLQRNLAQNLRNVISGLLCLTIWKRINYICRQFVYFI